MKKILLIFILSLSILTSWANIIQGNTTLPDGTIMQWGTTFAVKGSQSVYLSIPFPNGGYSVTVTPQNAPDSGYVGAIISSETTDVFTLTSTMSGPAAKVNYIAIGH